MYELLKLAALFWRKIQALFEFIAIIRMEDNSEIFIEDFL